MKLKEQEISALREIDTKSTNIVKELGQITIAINNLETRKVTTLESLDTLRLKENQLAKQLEDTYGKGTVDIQSGEFKPL